MKSTTSTSKLEEVGVSEVIESDIKPTEVLTKSTQREREEELLEQKCIHKCVRARV